MKIKVFLLSLISSILALPLLSPAFANAANLYDQPKTDAKIVGKIDLAAGIIPIFTPKDSAWTKVADPRNGNVGWIKSTDLNAKGRTNVTFTQRIVTNGNGSHSYQFIVNGQPQKLTNPQVQNIMQKMQLQQRARQAAMQRAMRNMIIEMQNMNDDFQVQWHDMQLHGGFPFGIPVVIMPGAQSRHPVTSTTIAQHPIVVKQTVQPQNVEPVKPTVKK